MRTRVANVLPLIAGLSVGCTGLAVGSDASVVSRDADAGVTDVVALDVVAPVGPAQVRMDFTHAGGFYSAPFPSEDRRGANGAIDITGFPNPRAIPFVQNLLAYVPGNVDGFGATSAVYFQLTAALDPARLPAVHESVRPDATVFLLSVDAAAPDYLRRYPATVHFEANGGPFGASNLLSLLPYQGLPLRPRTLYAAVVRRDLRDAQGNALQPSPAMAALAAGTQPAGLSEAAWGSYRAALAGLQAAAVNVADVAGLAVFRTGAPAEGMALARDELLARPAPAPTAPFVLREVFADYCVYASTIRMPEFQGGQPPYSNDGGGWVRDAAGHLVLQREEEANIVLTVPRRAMPAAGFPVAVFIRTGGGGERPLVDRGVHAVVHGEAIEPGTGPALYFARAGFAGLSVDGPHGGLRNVTHGDEQFLMFNITNELALRDNIRQSALELALLPRVLPHITVDVSGCAGAGDGATVTFDANTMALMGHSMGATIAPLVLAVEPHYGAAVLSGAGGSWIANVMYKQSPLAVLPIAELLVGYSGIGRHLHEHDPVLSLFQWAGEAADPPLYGRYVLREPRDGAPRNVLMLQGIVDTYILPPIANATSLSLGLDLVTPYLDATDARLAQYTPLRDVLDLGATRTLNLAAQGNFAGVDGRRATAVVVQHAGDNIEDGHEAVFQTEPPKHQYQCFLQSFARGSAAVPPPSGTADPCP